MRMSSWTPDVVRFMEDAARGTSYFADLAAVVRRHCAPGARVLDAGCGMGQLALALAGHAGRVDAVDCSPQAVAYVERAARKAGASNVRALRGDMLALKPGRPYDLAVFCLSASFEDAYEACARMGARRVLVVNKIHREPDATRPVVDDFGLSLARNRGVDARCTGEVVRLDYGQPLRSLADAAAYFGLFRTRTYPDGISQRDVEPLLERRDDPEFPYYLPVARTLAVFACKVAPAHGGRAAPARPDRYRTPSERSSATACILECTPSLA